MDIVLHCLSGDLAGQSFPAVGEEFAIGRSRTTSLRSSLPDVSAVHAILKDHDGVPVLHVVSTRQSEADGERLSAGDERVLQDGMTLRFGSQLVFRVSLRSPAAAPAGDVTLPPGAETVVGTAADDRTLPPGAPAPAPARPQPTVPVAPSAPAPAPAAPPSGGGKTQFFDLNQRTQAVTPEELDRIAAFAAVKRQRRFRIYGLVAGAIVLFLLFAAAASSAEKRKPIGPIAAAAGYAPQTLTAEKPYQRVYQVFGATVRVRVEVSESPEELRRTRSASLTAWLAEKNRQPGAGRYEVNPEWIRVNPELIVEEGMVPARPYTLHSALGRGLQTVKCGYRRIDPAGGAWVGEALLLRKGERRWVLTREVTAADAGRAANLFLKQTNTYFSFGKMTEEKVDAFWDYFPLPNRAELEQYSLADVTRLLAAAEADKGYTLWRNLEGAICANLTLTQAGSPERTAWEDALARFRALQRKRFWLRPVTALAEAEREQAVPFRETDRRKK